MDLNAIVYSLFLEYTGKKSSLLDSACLYKASTEEMKDNDRVYTLINVARLYAFAGFYPVYDAESLTRLKFVRKNEEKIIDLSNFVSEKDGVLLIIDAIASQPQYKDAHDPKLEIYKSLKDYYDLGKDFDYMFINLLQGIDVELSVLKSAVRHYIEYIDAYSKDESEKINDDNLVNVVMSEVLEDLQELIKKR